MTFHDRRFKVARKVESLKSRNLLKSGALSINLWNSMPAISFGSEVDDWNAIGSDIRLAMKQFADERG